MSEEWVALHVFYSSNVNPIVVEAVRPLVDELKADKLIDRWFFIKYWMEGPHLRLRLRLTDPAARTVVLERATTALSAFLKRRGALYDYDTKDLGPLYKTMYLAEYSEEQWDEEYGPDGEMPFRPNNSIAAFPYEPEHDRYGGPVGMDIAEWHFEHSSDLACRLFATTNMRVRPLLLGMTGQLSLMLAYTFLGDDEKVCRFFTRYRGFWETSYDEGSDDAHESFDKGFELSREALTDRLDHIRGAVAKPLSELTGVELEWMSHCRELRDTVLAAAKAGKFEFPVRADVTTSLADDPEALATVLLSSYVHMTSNRLGASILDETYLAYVVERCLTSADEDLVMT